MRCLLTALVVLSGTYMVLVEPAVAADARFPQGNARRSMGNLGPKQPAAKPRKPVAVPHQGYAHTPARGHFHYRPYPGHVYRQPYVISPYGSGYGYGYDYGYDPYRSEVYSPYRSYYGRPYLPPIYLPAETIYGPQAVKRFLGWGNENRPQADAGALIAGRADRAVVGDQDPPRQPKVRDGNQQAIASARKYLDYGDTHFSTGRYRDAYMRYRKASVEAPQLAEGHFRQGWALMGMNRPDLAAKAIRRGLELDPGWPQSNFRIDKLYGANQAAKKAHFDAMAKAAKENPKDADPWFVLGVHLHFDGQPDRAARFFDHARQLTVGDDAPLAAFAQ